jgi:hypothetical protein
MYSTCFTPLTTEITGVALYPGFKKRK